MDGRLSASSRGLRLGGGRRRPSQSGSPFVPPQGMSHDPKAALTVGWELPAKVQLKLNDSSRAVSAS